MIEGKIDHRKKLPSKIPDVLGLPNQKFTTQLGIINLNPNEYTHGYITIYLR